MSAPPSAAASTAPTHVSTGERWVIEPVQGHTLQRLRELRDYRRLTFFFGLKALQKLYARTYLGWAWLFIRPLFPLFVKTLIFGGLLAVGSEGVPYFLFLVTATTVWDLFSSCLMWGTRGLELNRGLLRQMYVPRLIMVVSNMTPAFLAFVIYLAVLALALVWYGVRDDQFYLTPGNLGWAVLAMCMAVGLAFSISLWTSVPAMAARDVRFTVGYVLGFWVFLTPVMYPLSAWPEEWRPWLLLNPMAAIVETFKYGVLGIGEVQSLGLVISGAVILVNTVAGLVFFMRWELNAAVRA